MQDRRVVMQVRSKPIFTGIPLFNWRGFAGRLSTLTRHELIDLHLGGLILS